MKYIDVSEHQGVIDFAKPSIKDDAIKWASSTGLECNEEIAIALFKYHKMFGSVEK